MRRIVVVSALLAVVGALAPWNGSAGASLPTPEHRDAPVHAPAGTGR